MSQCRSWSNRFIPGLGSIESELYPLSAGSCVSRFASLVLLRRISGPISMLSFDFASQLKGWHHWVWQRQHVPRLLIAHRAATRRQPFASPDSVIGRLNLAASTRWDPYFAGPTDQGVALSVANFFC